MKEDEEVHSGRTYTRDPWTRRTIWGLAREGRGAGWRWAKGEKVGTTVIP